LRGGTGGGGVRPHPDPAESRVVVWGGSLISTDVGDGRDIVVLGNILIDDVVRLVFSYLSRDWKWFSMTVFVMLLGGRQAEDGSRLRK